MPDSSINYPGAFIRDNTTVVLRYSTDHGVLEATSEDEGVTWSAPTNASQPDSKQTNVTVGSAWQVMLRAPTPAPLERVAPIPRLFSRHQHQRSSSGRILTCAALAVDDAQFGWHCVPSKAQNDWHGRCAGGR